MKTCNWHAIISQLYISAMQVAIALITETKLRSRLDFVAPTKITRRQRHHLLSQSTLRLGNLVPHLLQNPASTSWKAKPQPKQTVST